jgi:hypothetical protein
MDYGIFFHTTFKSSVKLFETAIELTTAGESRDVQREADQSARSTVLYNKHL